MKQNIQWLRRAAALFSVLAFLGSFAAARQKSGDGPAARLSEAPHSARSLRNPFFGDKSAVAAGRNLFKQHCAECHGEDGYGLGRAANLHVPAIQTAPPGSLFWALRNGRIRRGMPSWSELPDQQLWQMVTYIESLKKK